MSNTQLMYLFHSFLEGEREMREEFKRHAEVALQKYFDARNLPRKKKKIAKKEALADYSFYINLAEFNRYEF